MAIRYFHLWGKEDLFVLKTINLNKPIYLLNIRIKIIIILPTKKITANLFLFINAYNKNKNKGWLSLC